ncbi:hypothetical protein, partial [Gracilibacillus kekensis]|uniref:hypothetical protein n=1 Tax=Gracilibacillus kekensis TaxID=1027249 RepID=UPI001B8BDC68
LLDDIYFYRTLGQLRASSFGRYILLSDTGAVANFSFWTIYILLSGISIHVGFVPPVKSIISER